MTAVIAGLLSTLKDPDSDVRCSAICAVQQLALKISTPEMINGLIRALLDQSSNVRKAAALALGNLGSNTAMSEVNTGLLLALNDEDGDVQFNAASPIERLGVKAATPEVIDGLLHALRDGTGNWRTAYALEILVKRNPAPEVIAVLLAAIRNQDHYVRYNVIRALEDLDGKKTTPEVINWLLLAVDDAHDDVRNRAVSALRRLQLCSAALSKLNTDILSRLATYEYVFDSTALSELIGAYLETQNEIWLSIIFNQALKMGFGVTLVEEYILVFGNEEMPSEIEISTQKTPTVSEALIQSFGNQAEKYGLRWN